MQRGNACERRDGVLADVKGAVLREIGEVIDEGIFGETLAEAGLRAAYCKVQQSSASGRSAF